MNSSDYGDPSDDAAATQRDLISRVIGYQRQETSSQQHGDESPTIAADSNLPLQQSDLFECLKALYRTENEFSLAAFAAHVKMVDNALKACSRPFLRKVVEPKPSHSNSSNSNRVIYAFTDEKISKMDLHVGLIRECRENSELSLRHYLAVVLYQRKEIEKVGEEEKEANKKDKDDNDDEANSQVGAIYSGEPSMEVTEPPGKRAKLPRLAKVKHSMAWAYLAGKGCLKPSGKTVRPKDEELGDGETRPAGQDPDSGFRFEFVSYLAIMELRMNDSKGLDIFAVDDYDGTIFDPRLATYHSILNQEIAYVMDKVLPGLASCGLQIRKIPLFAIVGKKRFVALAQNLCCLERELIVAEKCCYFFQYSITSFGSFADAMPLHSNRQASGPMKRKVRVVGKTAPYIVKTATVCRHFVGFGFATALKAAEAMAENVDKPICLPLSGEKLIIEDFQSRQTSKSSRLNESANDVILYPGSTLKVLATAASTSRHRADVDVWLADLFHGTLSPATLRKLFTPRDVIESLWFREPPSELDTENRDVIVKVSSCAVHRQLVALCTTSSALSVVHKDQALKEILSRVVWTIFELPLGFVTIMRDLRQEGYNILQVSRIDSRTKTRVPRFPMPCLWDAVGREVLRALLPMAEAGVVHCDIRPGYDVTSNILVKQDGDELDLILIDYESLAQFRSLRGAFHQDGRFLPTKFAKDAIGYLWWQCLSLAFVWAHEINQGKLREFDSSLSNLLDRSISRAKRWQTVETTIVHDDFESWLFSDTPIRNIITSKGEFDVAVDDMDRLLARVSEYFRRKANHDLNTD